MNLFISRLSTTIKWSSFSTAVTHGRLYPHSQSALLRYASTNSGENIEKVELANTPSLDGKAAVYGVFWGERDPMNTLMQCQPTRNSAFYSAIEAMNLALRQAIHERKLTDLEIHTDSEYLIKCAESYLKNWRRNGYMTKNGTPVKHKEDLEHLDDMLGMIKVKFTKIDSSRPVLQKLKEDSSTTIKFDPLETEDGEMYRPNSSDKNVIFVRADSANKKTGFMILGYGIHFPGKDYLNIKGRFAQFPYSLFRAQLYGILMALETAKIEGLKDVKIVCDSPMFLKFYKNGWKKNDGGYVKNHHFYEKIAQLAKELNATFQYLPPESEDPNFIAAAQLAEDGLGMPLENKNSPETNEKSSGGRGRKKKVEEDAD